MKHFDDPLTIFVHETNHNPAFTVPNLLLPSSFPFLDYLLARVHAPSPSHIPPSPTHSASWLAQTIPSLLASVDDARVAFKTKMRKTKVALGLMKRVKEFMLRQGLRSADDRNAVDFMIAAMRGRLGRDGRYFGTMVKYVLSCFCVVAYDSVRSHFIHKYRKLPAAKLRSLLEDMHTYFHNMPSHVRREEEAARTKIVGWISALASEPESSQSGFVMQLAVTVGEWLISYFLYVPYSILFLVAFWSYGKTPDASLGIILRISRNVSCGIYGIRGARPSRQR
jgi:origin recognition complex subunit 3